MTAVYDIPLREWSGRDAHTIRVGHRIHSHLAERGEAARTIAAGKDTRFSRRALAILECAGMVEHAGADIWRITTAGRHATYRDVRRALTKDAIKAKTLIWTTGTDGARKAVWR